MNKSKVNLKQKQDREWKMVSLTLLGKNLDPYKITETLNIIPISWGKRGESFTKTKKHKHGYWLIGGGSTGWKIETQMKNILKKISPVRHKLKKLIKEDITIKWAFLTIVLDPPEGVANACYYFDSEMINEFTSLGIGIQISIDIKSEWDKAYAEIEKRNRR
jgi:hypothetical protein